MELLLVIIVIGILATVGIVTYSGSQNRARIVSVQSDAKNALSAMDSFRVFSADGQYPADLASAQNAGLKVSNGNTAIYTSYNGNAGFCAQIQNNVNTTISYYVTGQSTDIKSGACVTTKNLVLYPRGSLFDAYTANIIRTAGVTWNGKSNWNRYVYTGTPSNLSRYNLNLSDLTNGQTYTSSVLLGNDTATAVTAYLDFCDSTPVGFTLQPGEQRRVSITTTRATYDSTYRFLDLAFTDGTAANILVADAMVSPGNTAYDFADGNSPNWAWAGTVNASTSTGPAL